MYEEYDSDAMLARYDRDANTVKLEWKKEASGDDYRTPLMHTAELIRKHGCDTMIIDATKLGKVNDPDKNWTSKVLLPAWEKAGLEEIIFIGGEPGGDFKDKIKVKTAASVEEAEELLKKEAHPSAEVSAMTKDEAIKYLGLEPGASKEEIDDKFYLQVMRYRKSKEADAEQKLADLSCAYHIASGRKEEEEQREREHDEAKKYFGKTAEDWRTFFGYHWVKFVFGAGMIIFAASLINFFFFSGTSCTVISFGNFGHNSYYMTSVLELYEYSNPYVASVTYVVPNTEGQENSAYASQTLAAFFSADPNVLITDEMTYVYYYAQFADLTDVYEILKDDLPQETLDSLTPIYMSELEAYNLTKTYYEQIYAMQEYESDIDESELSDEPVLIGLEITDPEMIDKLGYENYWEQQPGTLVFGIYSNTSDMNESIKVLEILLKAAG